MTESEVILFLRGLSKPELQRVVQTAVGRAQVVWPCPECDEIHSTHSAPSEAISRPGEGDLDYLYKLYDVYVSHVDQNKRRTAVGIGAFNPRGVESLEAPPPQGEAK